MSILSNDEQKIITEQVLLLNFGNFLVGYIGVILEIRTLKTKRPNLKCQMLKTGAIRAIRAIRAINQATNTDVFAWRNFHYW
jgi:hypothetical protein